MLAGTILVSMLGINLPTRIKLRFDFRCIIQYHKISLFVDRRNCYRLDHANMSNTVRNVEVDTMLRLAQPRIYNARTAKALIELQIQLVRPTYTKESC